MKRKRVIQLALMLVMVLAISLFINKEVSAIDYMRGTVSYSTVNGKTIQPGANVSVSNGSTSTTVFRNANVYCIQKGTSLGSYASNFKIGNEIKINQNSDSTLKGFAYILSFSPSSVTNPNLYGTANPIQKILWKYIYYLESNGKAEKLRSTLGFSYIQGGNYELTGEDANIYKIAVAIAEDGLSDIQNKVNEVRKYNEGERSTLPTDLEVKINGITLTGREKLRDDDKEVDNFWYFDINKISATLYKFSGGARQGLILLGNATKDINNITINGHREPTGSFSVQKYISKVVSAENKTVYESTTERRNRLTFSHITDNDLKKANDVLKISAELTAGNSRFYEERSLFEIWKFPEIPNAAIARNLMRIPSIHINETSDEADTTKIPKREDPVIISDNDKVTYTIEAYYNGGPEKGNPPDNLYIKDVWDRYNLANSEFTEISITNEGTTRVYSSYGKTYYLVQNYLSINSPDNKILELQDAYYNSDKITEKLGTYLNSQNKSYGAYTYEPHNNSEYNEAQPSSAENPKYTDGNVYTSSVGTKLTYAYIAFDSHSEAESWFNQVVNSTDSNKANNVGIGKFIAELDFGAGKRYYCFRVVEGYNLANAGEYLGVSTANGSFKSRWIVKSNLEILNRSGHKKADGSEYDTGVALRATIADNIMLFEAQPEQVQEKVYNNFTDNLAEKQRLGLTAGTTGETFYRTQYWSLMKKGIKINVTVKYNSTTSTEDRIIENRVELLNGSAENEYFRIYDEDYIKIINRNKQYTFTKKWDISDDRNIPDTVVLDVYNSNKEKIDTIELSKSEESKEWTLTKEYNADNIPVYVKEVDIKYALYSEGISNWDIYYSNTDETGEFGLIKNNSITITNRRKSDNIDLTVEKVFDKAGYSGELPKKVGFIIKENGLPSFDHNYTFDKENNSDNEEQYEYIIHYINIGADGKGSIVIEDLDIGKQYEVEEVCIVDGSGKVTNIYKTQWSPSYSGTITDRKITITNSYNQDVSLQKYIIKVNDASIRGRENQKALDGNESKNEIYSLGERVPTTSGTLIKSKNPVEINKGAKVTYRITVYNNKESEARNVYVIDDLPTSITGFTIKTGQSYNQITSKQIKINLGNIAGKTKVDIEIEVTFPDRAISSDAERTNTATVYADNNTTEYRTVDSDYVLMTRVDISLQKYIIELNDGTSHAISGRENRKAVSTTKDPIYKNTSGNNVNSSGDTKYNDPVYIDSGNIVKYKINVYNNCDKTATNVIVTDTLPETATEYSYDGTNYTNLTGDNKIITLPTIATLNPGSSVTKYVYVKFEGLTDNVKYANTAQITDADQVVTNEYRIEDSDYVEKAIYAVSLEKYVTKIEATSNSYSSNAAKDYADGRKGEAEHKYDNDTNTNNYNKKNESITDLARIQEGEGPVPVNSGDNVTYKIVIKNDGNVPVKITKINDVMDIGINNNNNNQTIEEITDLSSQLINPGESKTITRTYPIVAQQITMGILENSANITELTNKYDKSVTDTTINDNKDSDYIRLKGIIISGYVWEDTSDLKDNSINGLYDRGESLKDGIKVILQQSTDGNTFNNYREVETDNGDYIFEDVPHYYRKTDGSYDYYKYRVIFEYDGVTYTNTTKGAINASNYKINSNAEETEREAFNNKFAEIKSDGAYNESGTKSGNITYTTTNEDGKAPMSVHNYNEDLMEINSLTNTINVQDYNSNAKLDYLKYINLGLRGRDVFDLRINTQVDSANVTINGVTGTYKYDEKEGIQIRTDNDIVMTNDASKMDKDTQEGQTRRDQQVRQTDQSSLQAIEVTYKVTVKNESQTLGQATQITDYFDKTLEFTGAEYNGSSITTTPVDSSNSSYNKVIITMPNEKLEQSERIDIYLKFNVLDEGLNAIKQITEGQAVPFYNLAEIESYKTEKGNSQEAIRGLIDRDSAPGSADEEIVRLSSGTSNSTTVQYYFAKTDLIKIKYEDDTSTAPILVFTTSNNQRTLTGIVFEDDTTVVDNVRSGDGKLGNKYAPNSTTQEDKIEGIKVELIDSDGNTYDTQITDSNGAYTFTGFLPGEYTIKYTYCGDEKTIYYNGQAYQSTNPYEFDGKVSALTNSNNQASPQYWYLIDGGYSVAKDDETRRAEVNNNWTTQNNETTTIFNYIRNKGASWNPYTDYEFATTIKECNNTITDTDAYISDFISKNTMFAQTNTMKVEVEMPNISDNRVTLSDEFDSYDINNTNFGIAQRPKTIIDTVLGIKKLTITDSSGKVLALAEYEDDELKVNKGQLLVDTNRVNVQISDNYLQGANIEVVYNVTITNDSERNYDNAPVAEVKIGKVISYIDDNLRFISTDSIQQLANNENEARVTFLTSLVFEEEIEDLMLDSLTGNAQASIRALAATPSAWKLDNEKLAKLNGDYKTTIVSSENNGLTNVEMTEGASVSETLTLSKTMATQASGDEQAYNGVTEIAVIETNSGRVIEDILNNGAVSSDPDVDPAGADYTYVDQESDTGVAPLITITPPTGENRDYTEVIIVAIVSLAVITLGIIGIKKFLKK